MQKDMLIKQVYDMDAETYRNLLSLKGEQELNNMIANIESVIQTNFVAQPIPEKGIVQEPILIIKDNRINKLYEFSMLVRNNKVDSTDLCYLKSLLVKMLSYSQASVEYIQNADCYNVYEEVLANLTEEKKPIHL